MSKNNVDWSDDLLDRKRDANFLEKFLVARVAERNARKLKGSYVLNIDAEWGAGKTFFLERFGAQLQNSGHLVAHIDAWKEDYADDPLIGVLAAIDGLVEKSDGKVKTRVKKAWKVVKANAGPIIARGAWQALKTLGKKAIGVDAVEVLAPVGATTSATDVALQSAASEVLAQAEHELDMFAEHSIKTYLKQNDAARNFQSALAQLFSLLSVNEQKPVFILIDELDRCRPSYAVSLLERVKHFFDVDNLVFVFATNTGQLRHTISGLYGPGFDGARYLHRFFHRSYLLTSPSREAFIASEALNLDLKKHRAPGGNIVRFLTLAADEYSMELREIQRVMDIIGSVQSVWEHDVPIELAMLLPLAVHFNRENNVDIESVEKSISRKFVIELGKSRNFRTRQETTPALNVQSLFSVLIHNSQNLHGAANMNRGSGHQAYAYEVFAREWNGKDVEHLNKSVQATLPTLVANAGLLERGDGS